MPEIEGRILHNNKMWDSSEQQCGILNVAQQVMEGEIFYRQAKYEEAFESLRKAVKLEENLKYDEPW